MEATYEAEVVGYEGVLEVNERGGREACRVRFGGGGDHYGMCTCTHAKISKKFK